MKQIRILIPAFLFCFTGYAQSLTGTKWILISIDRLETSKSKLVDKRFESNIMFNADSTFVGVTCNEYKGKFSTQHNKNINMNVLSVKKLGCVWLDELEKEVLKHLKTVNHFRVKADNLFLFTTDGLRLTYGKTH